MVRNLAARRRFATLLREHLQAGTRPGGIGPDRWTYAAFAAEVMNTRDRSDNDSVSESSVRNWCNVEKPVLPMAISPILRALFGTGDRHAQASEELLAAFKAAGQEPANLADDAQEATPAPSPPPAEPTPRAADPAGPVGPKNSPKIFISYTAADEAWARWLEWIVWSAGYETVCQAVHFPAGADFVHLMDQVLKEGCRVLFVLSPQSAEAPFAQAEIANAFARDPDGTKRLLIPVRVVEHTPEGVLKTRIYIDLVGVYDEALAAKKVLNALLDQPDRSEAPPFPGGVARHVDDRAGERKPEFPAGPATPSACSGAGKRELAEAAERIAAIMVRSADLTGQFVTTLGLAPSDSTLRTRATLAAQALLALSLKDALMQTRTVDRLIGRSRKATDDTRECIREISNELACLAYGEAVINDLRRKVAGPAGRFVDVPAYTLTFAEIVMSRIDGRPSNFRKAPAKKWPEGLNLIPFMAGSAPNFLETLASRIDDHLFYKFLDEDDIQEYEKQKPLADGEYLHLLVKLRITGRTTEIDGRLYFAWDGDVDFEELSDFERVFDELKTRWPNIAFIKLNRDKSRSLLENELLWQVLDLLPNVKDEALEVH